MSARLTTAEILDGAADVIVRNGWTRGSFSKTDPDTIYVSTRDCPVCTLGAMNVAVGFEPDADLSERPIDAYRAFARHLRLNFTDDMTVIEFSGVIGDHWNDAPDRTAEQVVTELRACAENLRSAVAS